MKKQLGFLVDVNRCVGCNTCEIACKQEYNISPGIKWRRTYTVNPEGHPEFPTYYFSLACNHCDNPLCSKGCPAGAYTKREKDGIVIHNQDKCIGCRYCTWNCFYGTPQFNKEKGRVEKCNLCYERIDKGLEPVCVIACPVQALKLIEIESNKYDDIIPGFRRLNFKPSVKFILPENITEKEIILNYVNKIKSK